MMKFLNEPRLAASETFLNKALLLFFRVIVMVYSLNRARKVYWECVDQKIVILPTFEGLHKTARTRILVGAVPVSGV